MSHQTPEYTFELEDHSEIPGLKTVCVKWRGLTLAVIYPIEDGLRIISGHAKGFRPGIIFAIDFLLEPPPQLGGNGRKN